MIIKKTEDVQRQVIGNLEGFDMQISTEDMQWLMRMLSDLYKDPYSIIPQEWISNAWDSHLEADCSDKPIVCQLKKDDSGKWFFAVQDFGVGISPKRIRIFGSYGKSTKRTNPSPIGGFGIGAKSFLSYTDTCFIDTVYDGVEYKYLCSLNDLGVPRIDELYKIDTTKSNQSRLMFYLKKPSDYYNFYEGLKRKTLYFDNLVYDLDSSLQALNSAVTYRGKTFAYNEHYGSGRNMHLILGQVPYPINYTQINQKVLTFPVGIIIPIDSPVMPTPTREDIKYTSEAIDYIKGRITETCTELVKLCNKERVVITDPLKWKKWVSLLKSPTSVTIGGKNVSLGNNVISQSSVPLNKIVFEPLRGLSFSYPHSVLDQCFVATHKINNSLTKIEHPPLFGRSQSRFLRREGSFNPIKNRYIADTFNQEVYILKRNKLKLKNYISILGLKYAPKTTWRSSISKYQKFVDAIWDSIESYDDLVIPEEKVELYKKPGRYKLTGEIILYEGRHRLSYNQDFNCTFEKKYLKLQDIPKFRKNYIYGFKEQVKGLDLIWALLEPQKHISVVYTSKINLEYLKNFSNFMSVEEFLKGHNRPFKRIITGYMISRFIKRNSIIFDNKEIIKRFSVPLYQNMIALSKYEDQYYRSVTDNNKFLESAVELAQIHKYYDHIMMSHLNYCKKKFEYLDFLRFLRRTSAYNFSVDPACYDFIVHYLKKNTKFRMDLHCYQNENRRLLSESN